MHRYEVHIYRDEELVTTIPLAHEYADDESAAREAEDIADWFVREDNEDWTLRRLS